MKYYKDTSTGLVYAYETDGSQDLYILNGLIPMSPEEVQQHLSDSVK